jgi:hypothetical protein
MKKLLSLVCIMLVASLVQAADAYKVGSWNEYKYYNDDKTTGSMKMSVVGQEAGGFWVEYVTRGVAVKSTEKTIMKMLVVQGKESSVVKRMIVQNGKEPAKEIPESMTKFMAGGQGSSGLLSDMKDIKKFYTKQDQVEITEKENVKATVPAGTFKCKYTKVLDKKNKRTTEIYVSESVVPAGIVKSLENGKVRMELVKSSLKGAKSEIAGTVEKMQMPNMPSLDPDQLKELDKALDNPKGNE